MATLEKKRCSRCWQPKPLTDFGLDSRGRKGRKAKCRKCLAIEGKQYVANMTLELKLSRGVSIIKWRERNPEKRQAHIDLMNALAMGKIKKQPCVVCGDLNSNAHHQDYDKPYDVIWLCALHHSQLHHGRLMLN
jgi:hypothetical protein